MRNYNKIPRGILSVDEINSEAPRTAVVINCDRLNVRDQPNKYGHAFHVLTAGDIVSVNDLQNGWAHITSGTNIEGYVMEEYIKEG